MLLVNSNALTAAQPPPSLAPSSPPALAVLSPGTGDLLPIQIKLQRRLRWVLALTGLLPVGVLGLTIPWVTNPAWILPIVLFVALGTILAIVVVTRRISVMLDRSTREMRELAITVNHSAGSIVTELTMLRRRIEELAAQEATPPNQWN